MSEINLLQTTDAGVWAKEFMRLHGNKLPDEGLMIAWFANMWAATHDPLTKEIERLTEELAFQTACHEELRGHMKEADDRIEKLERVLVAAKKVTAIDAITITDANYLSYLEGAIAEVSDE